MSKFLKKALNSDIGISALYHIIRGYQATWHFTVEGEQPWLDHLSSGGSVILCCWHQQFFSAIRHFKTYGPLKPSIMISQSRDGGVVAGIASRTDWDVVRGSSSNGGAEALEEMTHKLRGRGMAAHVLDGPRGPAGKIKAGVIRLAQLAGAVIVPFYVTAERPWFFNSWDRFMVPKPFARVVLTFGDLFRLPAISGPDEFERERLRLEEVMRPGLLLE